MQQIQSQDKNNKNVVFLFCLINKIISIWLCASNGAHPFTKKYDNDRLTDRLSTFFKGVQNVFFFSLIDHFAVQAMVVYFRAVLLPKDSLNLFSWLYFFFFFLAQITILGKRKRTGHTVKYGSDRMLSISVETATCGKISQRSVSRPDNLKVHFLRPLIITTHPKHIFITKNDSKNND